MSGFILTIVLNEGKVDVVGNCWKESRGEREFGTGLQLSPDEPAGFEIESVLYNGVDVTDIVNLVEVYKLTEKELSKC